MRFDYCQLLLDEGENDAVIDRAKYTLNIAKENNWLSDIALDQLSIGRAYFQQAMYQDALIWIDQSISIFHGAGYIDILPFGLLNRAALHRHTRDFARAQAELQKVFDIADGSGMRLHLTDYHLEMARLLVAASGFDFAQPANSETTRCLSGVEGNMQSARIHIAEAERLIKATGYHRRDKELAELQAQL